MSSKFFFFVCVIFICIKCSIQMKTMTVNLKQCIRYACRADKWRYWHDRRADKLRYRHDLRVDKQCYWHDRHADSQCRFRGHG